MLSEAQAQQIRVQTVNELLTEIDRAIPGTEILLMDGLYRLSGSRVVVDRPGANNARITVRSESQNGAIIETNGAESAFQIEQPYWTFDGLHIKVTNGSAHAYKLQGNGQYTTIQNGKIELDSPAEGGIKGAGGPRAPQPDYALIRNNEIWFTSPTRNNNCEGIDGVAVKGWVIRRNWIHHIQKSNQGFDGIGWGVFTKGNSQDTIIEGNLIHDSFVSISFGGGGTGAEFFRDGDTRYEEQNGIIRNNIVFNSGDVAVYLNDAKNARIYNNTFFNSFTTCGAGCSSVDVRFSGSTADIRNNILDKPINDRDGGRHTATSNLFLASPTDSTWFVDVSNQDFRLKQNAQPIDNGERIALVSEDYYGISRPQGAAYDIGAVEYQVTMPSLPDAGQSTDLGFYVDAVSIDTGLVVDDASTPLIDAAVLEADGGPAQLDSSESKSQRQPVIKDQTCSCRSLDDSGNTPTNYICLTLGVIFVRLRRRFR